MWPVPLAQVFPHPQLIFPSKTWFFGIYLNFQWQKSLISHIRNFIKSCSSRSVQQHQRHIPIPPKFSATIYFNFQRRNHSIFKNFCTATPKRLEPSPCTPPPKTPRTRSEASQFSGSHNHKTKQTTFLHR